MRRQIHQVGLLVALAIPLGPSEGLSGQEAAPPQVDTRIYDIIAANESLDQLSRLIAEKELQLAEQETRTQGTREERERIEVMTQALVKQILHAPTNRLRAEASCPQAPEYATVARTLFGLKHEGLCSFSGQSCPISTAAD